MNERYVDESLTCSVQDIPHDSGLHCSSCSASTDSMGTGNALVLAPGHLPKGMYSKACYD